MIDNKLLELFPAASLDPENKVHMDEDFGKKSTTNYCVFIMPRTGSTYLTHLLRKTQKLGYPQEWLNHTSIQPVITKLQANGLEQYFDRLMRHHSSKNGVFGIEVSFPQVEMAKHAFDFYGALGRHCKFFYVRRRNIVAQAISLFVANASGVFHSYEVNEESHKKRQAIEFDGEAIAKYVMELVSFEQKFEQEFENSKIEPDRLYYEDIISEQLRTLLRFKNVVGLGSEIDFETDPPIQKLDDSGRELWEPQFRELFSEFLDQVKIERPPVQYSGRIV